MNFDGNADIVTFVHDANSGVGDVWVALSNKNDFGPSEVWHGDFCRNSQVCQLGNVNLDGRADAVVFMQNTVGQEFDVRVALSVK